MLSRELLIWQASSSTARGKRQRRPPGKSRPTGWSKIKMWLKNSTSLKLPKSHKRSIHRWVEKLNNWVSDLERIQLPQHKVFSFIFVPQFILPAQITSPILNKFPKISSLLENCLYCYYSAYFLTHLMLFSERKYIVKNTFISISILAFWLKMVATVLSESNILYVHVLCATNPRILKIPKLDRISRMP